MKSSSGHRFTECIGACHQLPFIRCSHSFALSIPLIDPRLWLPFVSCYTLEGQGEEMERPMDASDIMSCPVVTVALDTTVTELARIMIEQRISAVPVMDKGAMVGMVTEGDLLRRAEIGSDHRRSRWAEFVFANWNLAAEYTKEHGRRASDVMTHPVVTVAPTATPGEIADILESRHIKRVPVVENGELVGIVSRANLVQALASSVATLQPSTTALDRDIRAKLCSELSEQPWSFPPTETNVIVDHGEVHLWGYIATESARRAIVVTAENIPGVRRVHDHMDYPAIRPRFLP